jgi:uncharacterized protein YcbK (DUF882 family)
MSNDTDVLETGLNRREILKTGLIGFLGMLPMMLLGPEAKAAGMALPNSGTFDISFRHQHTGEGFSGTYRVGGKYLPEAFERINMVLRDFRTGDIFPIDPRTIDILYMIRKKAGRTNSPYEILSGYRSPKTNAMLSRVSTGVAKNSLHLTGQAIDMRIPTYSTRGIRDIARGLRAGGVGYYPDSNFVHVDTGKVRHW